MYGKLEEFPDKNSANEVRGPGVIFHDPCSS